MKRPLGNKEKTGISYLRAAIAALETYGADQATDAMCAAEIYGALAYCEGDAAAILAALKPSCDPQDQ